MSHERTLTVLNSALADLEGMMQWVEPSGDRKHPGWKTIKELEREIKLFPKEIEALNKEISNLTARLENAQEWCVDDFLYYDQDSYEITHEQAEDALGDMMRHADANFGITWDTVYYYITLHGTERVQS